jgi:mannitol 2-dehydrogenase
MELNNSSLPGLDKRIHIPTYDRSALSAGIVHIGIGNFHRSHQAYILDKYIQKTNSLNWGICGVGLLPQDESICARMEKQDCLFTLSEKKEDGVINVSVIGSIIKCLHAPSDTQKVIQKMADSETKLVTLTITEGGYNYNSATGQFIMDDQLVIWDIENPDCPKTVFGYLTRSLDLRRKSGTGDVTIQSCDNIQHNGDVLRKMLLTFISLAQPDLKEWVDENVAFPNSMVDRITPVSVREDADFLKQEFQLDDLCPVVSETFFQWVIEDKFKNQRPFLEQLGVEYVKDVSPYENMKLRLLNAGHSFLGFLGKRAGYQFIHEAVADTSICNSLLQFYNNEAIPNIPDFPVSKLDGYVQTLLGRFGNPYIKDHIDRILSGSSAKIPKFLIPTINDQIQKGKSAEMSILILAAWYCYIERVNNSADINDEMSLILFEKVHSSVAGGRLEFVKIVSIFGDLTNNMSFVNQFESAVNKLE